MAQPAETPASQALSFPYLSGLSAHRLMETIALRVTPAIAAAAIASTRVNLGFEVALVFASVLLVAVLLRNPHYPMHLIPVASLFFNLLAAPLGAALAIALTAIDGHSATFIEPDQMVAPVLGAWIVAALGVWVLRSFRGEREVRVGVLGSELFAAGLASELRAVGVPPYKVAGWIEPEEAGGADQDPAASAVANGNGAGGNGRLRALGSPQPHLGQIEDLRTIVTSNRIELLVLGPLAPAHSEVPEERFGDPAVSRLDVFERVAEACLDLPVSMIEAGQLYEDLFGHVPLGTTNSAWFQYLLHPRYRGSWPLSKRMLDLILGAIAIVVTAPILILFALVIKLSDRGPVLHRQLRLGEGGREFEMIKLRTMEPNAEGAGGARWSGEDDGRVTAIGRFLRRSHIDELPQLWLVMRGEMSLVGPRPERPKIVSGLEERFRYYDRRLLVKPGITGWAQVRCGYGGSEIGTAWKLCHDLYYLKRRSTLFDLLIMAETLTTVVIPAPIKRPDERFIVGTQAREERLVEATTA